MPYQLGHVGSLMNAQNIRDCWYDNWLSMALSGLVWLGLA